MRAVKTDSNAQRAGSQEPARCAYQRTERLSASRSLCTPAQTVSVRCSQAANPFVKKEYFLTV